MTNSWNRARKSQTIGLGSAECANRISFQRKVLPTAPLLSNSLLSLSLSLSLVANELLDSASSAKAPRSHSYYATRLMANRHASPSHTPTHTHTHTAVAFEVVQTEVAEIIKDRIVVGHSLENDFKVRPPRHHVLLIFTSSYSFLLGHGYYIFLKIKTDVIIFISLFHSNWWHFYTFIYLLVAVAEPSIQDDAGYGQVPPTPEGQGQTPLSEIPRQEPVGCHHSGNQSINCWSQQFNTILFSSLYWMIKLEIHLIVWLLTFDGGGVPWIQLSLMK